MFTIEMKNKNNEHRQVLFSNDLLVDSNLCRWREFNFDYWCFRKLRLIGYDIICYSKKCLDLFLLDYNKRSVTFFFFLNKFFYFVIFISLLNISHNISFVLIYFDFYIAQFVINEIRNFHRVYHIPNEATTILNN